MSFKLQIDDLQEKHQPYAEIVGIENWLALSKEFGGTCVYIPKVKELEKLRKYRLIEDEFDGNNIKDLSTKYDLSESTIYRIIRNSMKKL